MGAAVAPMKEPLLQDKEEEEELQQEGPQQQEEENNNDDEPPPTECINNQVVDEMTAFVNKCWKDATTNPTSNGGAMKILGLCCFSLIQLLVWIAVLTPCSLFEESDYYRGKCHPLWWYLQSIALVVLIGIAIGVALWNKSSTNKILQEWWSQASQAYHTWYLQTSQSYHAFKEQHQKCSNEKLTRSAADSGGRNSYSPTTTQKLICDQNDAMDAFADRLFCNNGSRSLNGRDVAIIIGIQLICIILVCP